MAEYFARTAGKQEFELLQDGQRIALITYLKRYTSDAEIQVGGVAYSVKPHGFWGSELHVEHADAVLADFRMRWNMNIGLTTYFGTSEWHYEFKHRGVMKDGFVLVDERGQELLHFRNRFKLGTLGYEYTITTTEAFEEFGSKVLLLTILVHAANYYMRNLAAIAAAGS